MPYINRGEQRKNRDDWPCLFVSLFFCIILRYIPKTFRSGKKNKNKTNANVVILFFSLGNCQNSHHWSQDCSARFCRNEPLLLLGWVLRFHKLKHEGGLYTSGFNLSAQSNPGNSFGHIPFLSSSFFRGRSHQANSQKFFKVFNQFSKMCFYRQGY